MNIRGLISMSHRTYYWLHISFPRRLISKAALPPSNVRTDGQPSNLDRPNPDQIPRTVSINDDSTISMLIKATLFVARRSAFPGESFRLFPKMIISSTTIAIWWQFADRDKPW